MWCCSKIAHRSGQNTPYWLGWIRSPPPQPCFSAPIFELGSLICPSAGRGQLTVQLRTSSLPLFGHPRACQCDGGVAPEGSRSPIRGTRKIVMKLRALVFRGDSSFSPSLSIVQVGCRLQGFVLSR